MRSFYLLRGILELNFRTVPNWYYLRFTNEIWFLLITVILDKICGCLLFSELLQITTIEASHAYFITLTSCIGPHVIGHLYCHEFAGCGNCLTVQDKLTVSQCLVPVLPQIAIASCNWCSVCGHTALVSKWMYIGKHLPLSLHNSLHIILMLF